MRLPASECTTTFAYHLHNAIELTWSRIDVRTRLRRAILTNDLPITRRILRNNPSHLQSPDFSDKSNTSLHLAAQHGFLAIVEHLVDLGHDRTVPEDPLEILQRKRSASSHSNASSQLSQESEQDNYKELWEEDHYLDSSTLGISHNTDGATPLTPGSSPLPYPGRHLPPPEFPTMSESADAFRSYGTHACSAGTR